MTILNNSLDFIIKKINSFAKNEMGGLFVYFVLFFPALFGAVAVSIESSKFVNFNINLQRAADTGCGVFESFPEGERRNDLHQYMRQAIEKQLVAYGLEPVNIKITVQKREDSLYIFDIEVLYEGLFPQFVGTSGTATLKFECDHRVPEIEYEHGQLVWMEDFEDPVVDSLKAVPQHKLPLEMLNVNCSVTAYNDWGAEYARWLSVYKVSYLDPDAYTKYPTKAVSGDQYINLGLNRCNSYLISSIYLLEGDYLLTYWVNKTKTSKVADAKYYQVCVVPLNRVCADQNSKYEVYKYNVAPSFEWELRVVSFKVTKAGMVNISFIQRDQRPIPGQKTGIDQVYRRGPGINLDFIRVFFVDKNKKFDIPYTLNDPEIPNASDTTINIPEKYYQKVSALHKRFVDQLENEVEKTLEGLKISFLKLADHLRVSVWVITTDDTRIKWSNYFDVSYCFDASWRAILPDEYCEEMLDNKRNIELNGRGLSISPLASLEQEVINKIKHIEVKIEATNEDSQIYHWSETHEIVITDEPLKHFCYAVDKNYDEGVPFTTDCSNNDAFTTPFTDMRTPMDYVNDGDTETESEDEGPQDFEEADFNSFAIEHSAETAFTAVVKLYDDKNNFLNWESYLEDTLCKDDNCKTLLKGQPWISNKMKTSLSPKAGVDFSDVSRLNLVVTALRPNGDMEILNNNYYKDQLRTNQDTCINILGTNGSFYEGSCNNKQTDISEYDFNFRVDRAPVRQGGIYVQVGYDYPLGNSASTVKFFYLRPISNWNKINQDLNYQRPIGYFIPPKAINIVIQHGRKSGSDIYTYRTDRIASTSNLGNHYFYPSAKKGKLCHWVHGYDQKNENPKAPGGLYLYNVSNYFCPHEPYQKWDLDGRSKKELRFPVSKNNYYSLVQPRMREAILDGAYCDHKSFNAQDDHNPITNVFPTSTAFEYDPIYTWENNVLYKPDWTDAGDKNRGLLFSGFRHCANNEKLVWKTTVFHPSNIRGELTLDFYAPESVQGVNSSCGITNNKKERRIHVCIDEEEADTCENLSFSVSLDPNRITSNGDNTISVKLKNVFSHNKETGRNFASIITLKDTNEDNECNFFLKEFKLNSLGRGTEDFSDEFLQFTGKGEVTLHKYRNKNGSTYKRDITTYPTRTNSGALKITNY